MCIGWTRLTGKRHSPPHCGWREGDLKRNSILVLIAATIALAACTPANTPPPAAQPAGDERYLVDPRVGAPEAPPALDAKFDAAWRFVLAGNDAEASKRLEAIRTRNPAYLPAHLAPPAILIRDQQLDPARAIVDGTLAK